MLRTPVASLVRRLFVSRVSRRRRSTCQPALAPAGWGQPFETLTLTVEQLETRQLLTAGEFSILGGDPAIANDPNADVFVSYDRETDTLNFRVRDTIANQFTELVDVAVETNVVLTNPLFGNTISSGQALVRLDDAVEFRRTEFLNPDPDFTQFRIANFVQRGFARAASQSGANRVIVGAEELIRSGEQQFIAVRLSREGEVRRVPFSQLNAPAVEIRSSAGDRFLVDQGVTFNIDIVNEMPDNAHIVTVRISDVNQPGGANDREHVFNFVTDVTRVRQVELSTSVSAPGTYEVSVLVESVSTGNNLFRGSRRFEVVEPEPDTGRLVDDALVGVNRRFAINPFDVTLIGGGSAGSQSSFIRVGAISGTVLPGVTNDVSVRVTGLFATEADSLLVNAPNGVPLVREFNADPIEFAKTFSVEAGPIDAELGRTFARILEDVRFVASDEQSVEDSLFTSFASNESLAAIRLLDERLTFELIDDVSGEVLDTIELDKEQLLQMQVNRDVPVPNAVAQLRPLNIDLHLADSTIQAVNDGSINSRAVVTVGNILSNLGDVEGQATLRIDFGDGSDPEVRSFHPHAGRREGVVGSLSAGLRGFPPESLTDDLLTDDLFEHSYGQAGDFTVTAVLTLPNGLTAVEQAVISVVGQANVSIPFNTPLVVSAVPAANAQLALELSGSISNVGDDRSFDARIDLGSQSVEFVLEVDESGAFTNVSVPSEAMNLISLLLPDQQSRRLTGRLTLSSDNLRATVLPFEVELSRPNLAFVGYEKQTFPLQGEPFVFRGAGDEFEIDVPLLDEQLPFGSEIRATGTVVTTSQNITRLAESARAAFRNAGGSVGNSARFDVADNTTVTIRSFAVDSATGTRTLIDTLAVPTLDVVQPHVEISDTLSTGNFVFELQEFSPSLRFFGVRGDVEVRVKVQDVAGQDVFGQDELTFNVNGLTANTSSAFSNFLQSIEQVPGQETQADLKLLVRVLQGGTELASSTIDFTIADQGVGFLNGFDTFRVTPSDFGVWNGTDPFGMTLSIEANDPNPEDTLIALVLWGDGTVSQVGLDRSGSDDLLGRQNVSHFYSAEFLKQLHRETAGSIVSVPNPLVILSDVEGSQRERLAFPPEFGPAPNLSRTLEIVVNENPNLANAVVEAANGALASDFRVEVGDDLTVDLRSNVNVRNRFLNLPDGEQMIVEIDLGSTETTTVLGDPLFTGPVIRLVKTGGQGGSFFQIEQPDGSLAGRVNFNNVFDPVRGQNVPTIRLRDELTGTSLVQYSRAGRFTLSATILESDGTLTSFGEMPIAVFPKLEGVAITEDGSLTGNIIGANVLPQDITGSARVRIITPETGASRSAIVRFDDDLGELIFKLDGILQDPLRQGVDFVIEIPVDVLTIPDRGRLLRPVQIGAPDVTVITFDIPEVVERDAPVTFSVTLPENLQTRVNDWTVPVTLQMSVGDDQLFAITTGGQPLPADRLRLLRDAEDGFDEVSLVRYDRDTGRITFIGDDNLPFIRFRKSGPRLLQIFGEGSFGSAFVNVTNNLPAVINQFEVDDQGRLLGFLDIESANGIQLNVFGQLVNVGSGRQQLNAQDLGVGDRTDFVPGAMFDVSVTENGEEETTVTQQSLLNTAGNSRPVISNIDIELNEDGTANVRVDVTDADANDVTATLQSTTGAALGGPINLVGGNGFLDFNNIVIPENGEGLVRIDDGLGGEDLAVFSFINLGERLLIEIGQQLGVLEDAGFQRMLDAVALAFEEPLEQVQVTVEVTDGELADGTVDPNPQPGSGVSILSKNGTPAEIIEFLNNLVFNPNPNFFGVANLAIQLEDTADATRTGELDVAVPVQNSADVPVILQVKAIDKGQGRFEINGQARDLDGDRLTARIFDQLNNLLGEAEIDAAEPGATQDFQININAPDGDNGQPQTVTVALSDENGGVTTEQVTLTPNPFLQDLRVKAKLEAGVEFGGDVTVFQLSTFLNIIGDGADNAVAIFFTEEGIVVQGLGGTTVNGSTDPFVVPGTQGSSDFDGTLLTTMNQGEDVITVKGVTFTGSVEVEQPDENPAVALTLTPGDDLLIVEDVVSEGDLDIDVGPNDDVGPDNDEVILKNVVVQGVLHLQAGRGDDVVEIDGLVLQGDNNVIDLGEGNDIVRVNAQGRIVEQSGNMLSIDGRVISLIGVDAVQIDNTPLVIDLTDNDDDVVLTNHGDGSFTLQDLGGTLGADMTFTPSAAGVIVNGLDGDDTIDFSAATFAVVINGGNGDDDIDGGSNNDTLNGDDGDDLLVGDRGDDVINGGDDDDVLMGTQGNDTLLGASGDDTLVGHEGNDILAGGAGRDRLNGGDGDDRLRGQGASGDQLSGGAGNDDLDGGAGTDRVTETADVDFTATDAALAGPGSDMLLGIELLTLSGGSSANRIDTMAFSGSVILNGRGGNDTLLAGSGNDILNGGGGRDRLHGGAGNDRVRGQGSIDELSGGPGNDFIDGGAGNDLLVEEADVDFLLTDSRLTGLGTDTLAGIRRATLRGGASDNRIDATTFSGPVSLLGFGGDDLLLGGEFADQIRGGAGRDTLRGNGGEDGLFGQGGSGDDLDGGTGSDILDGGAGRDRIRFDQSDNVISDVLDLLFMS